jgi:putative adenylate-forming enzyme
MQIVAKTESTKMMSSPSALHILYCFLKLRFSRWFSSNKVSFFTKRKWRNNLVNSHFYKPFVLENREFPILNKTLFMEHFNAINTVGISKEEAFKVALNSEESRDFSPSINGISVGLSSGTSGNKGLFLTSTKEKANWVGAVLDRVIGFSLRKRKVAFFLRANNNLYESVKSIILTFHFFDIKTPIANHIKALIAVQADILVAQPSVLFEIARIYQAENIQSSFKKIISVAEVLEDDQKAFFEEVFRCRIDQVYQCTEGFLAHTCKKGRLHFNEDWLKIEKHYLDKEHKIFHPIITDYLRSSQPVVRYELNDIIHEGLLCDCGMKSTVIEKIEGRSDDVFRFERNKKKILIYPDFIRRAIINSSDAIVNYVVCQYTEYEIRLSLEVQDTVQKESVYLQASNALKIMLREMDLTDVDVVEFDYQHSPMNKFKRIRNDYKKTI